MFACGIFVRSLTRLAVQVFGKHYHRRHNSVAPHQRVVDHQFFVPPDFPQVTDARDPRIRGT